VDASQFALGAILWQRDPAMPRKLRAVGFYSKSLSPAEMNYSIHNQELLAVIRALRHWSHLLRGMPPDRPVLIWTDHKNLTYWAEPHKVGPWATLWQVELQQYNFLLLHKPGEQNKADALSRRPDYNTKNHQNDHAIILPWDRFHGLLPSQLKIHVVALNTDPDTLDNQVRNAQKTHLNDL
jgi:RNase H-like domain found in reverse transcriptase